MGWNGAHALVTQFEKRKKLVAGPATTRCGHTFKPCDVLCVKISHGIRTTSAVLDDEIRLPRSGGRSTSHRLLLINVEPSSRVHEPPLILAAVTLPLNDGRAVV